MLAYLDKIKKTNFYAEARYCWRAVFKYRHPWSYFINRFFVYKKIARINIARLGLPETDAYSFHTLCGHKHVFMLAWSLASWLYQTKVLPEIYLHADGSLTKDDELLLHHIFPRLRIIDPAEVKDKIVSALADYPHIRAYRDNYKKHPVYLPKLIDPYFVSHAPYKLFFDVDVLFFAYPKEVLANISAKIPFMAAGNVDMFLTEGLAGFRYADGACPKDAPGFVNGGIVGYPEEGFSLSALDYFFERCGPTSQYRLIEQAGYAYILNRNKNFQKLDQRQYHIKGAVGENTVTKHYTGPRREEFWSEGVKILKKRIFQ
ncbi:hypothetical protein A3H03_03070 [Candidatus Kuenenbacteria bacterium RIFCSPLOWO2_12_FULL_42_13]|uniref:Uncharacterized protein n=4 Tax=Candidatus Kueneniibacteriota TaxID=1752740 RepID=A0A0G0YXF3_9BACT|nr:MAG: hypothetical protein UV02_C0029G0010 [Candidatus Kuenenbacteria bacterium GW2011_GWA2_42_15]OGG89619.1 MAG: hypothetical protein A3C68_00210 [Candidatus Kuenenbacteria bacterium RIFCSPHIGHO2_02_FULL_42_29]OGG91206.1 MAG: hypothetical protein A3H55_03315 [Candidatus Kuenenbacteria bacterium RIFCSPLOWO2_02_FULL_42_16]OGG92306.1 MAG: hypothetical protein A3H03_03070 [Candidatus Kuenenbacteria bacterium RIFCSPLOWO2_12_FULL_42_13]OGH01291.1 MAG: hypothetical protein A3E04_01835 [Candidatus K